MIKSLIKFFSIVFLYLALDKLIKFTGVLYIKVCLPFFCCSFLFLIFFKNEKIVDLIIWISFLILCLFEFIFVIVQMNKNVPEAGFGLILIFFLSLLMMLDTFYLIIEIRNIKE